MADEAKIGTHWQDDELDAIVSDYFAMLASDLSGQPYVKSRHSQALMAQIGRTHRSVEFKHQNISAVLDELGMPWIPGYKPKRNYQNAIFGAIDRYLTTHPCATQEFDLRRYRHAVRWLAPGSRDPGRPETGRSRWFRANGRDARDRGTTPPLPLPVRASPCRETEC